jgi:cytochrome c oxidase subunit 2
MLSSIKSKEVDRFFLESHETELFWTSIPAFLLVFIAIPSIKTLYIMEELVSPLITIKAIGLQWHWRYEYSNLINKTITSIVRPSKKANLLTVSNNLVLPNLTPIRIIVTSKDVLHS